MARTIERFMLKMNQTKALIGTFVTSSKINALYLSINHEILFTILQNFAFMLY